MSQERIESFFKKTVDTANRDMQKNNANSSSFSDNAVAGEENSNVITKIVTVTLDASENYSINFNDESFAQSSGEEVKLVLEELFTAAVKILELDIKNIRENDGEVLTPLNPGPHYDSVISEFAIYVNANMEVVLNVAFGLGSDATVKLTENLEKVRENATQLKTYFTNAPLEDIRLGKEFYRE